MNRIAFVAQAALVRLFSGARLRLLLGAAAALAAAGLTHQPVQAAVHHAALLIEHGSGRVISRCVAFAEDHLSGLQLIQRSGVEVQVKSFGSLGNAVCQLDSEPASVPASCFGSSYWQYFHHTSSGWAQAATGPDAATVSDGDVDGWRYAAGSGQKPVAASLSQICKPVPAAAAPSRIPVSLPLLGVILATLAVLGLGTLLALNLRRRGP